MKAQFQMMLAEDNAGDILLVREALKEHRVNCALRVRTDGAEPIALLRHLDADVKGSPIDPLVLDMTPVVIMASADSSVLEEKAAKHAALSYFRKSSRLDEFLELGLIVRQILAGAEEAIPPVHTSVENVREA